MEAKFKEFLEKFRAEAEKSLKAEVSSMGTVQRTLMQAFLPIWINFVTNAGKACLVVQKSFDITIEEPSSSPDVLIEGDFETFLELFEKKDPQLLRKAEQEGKIKMTYYNFKGQQALTRVREYLTKA